MHHFRHGVLFISLLLISVGIAYAQKVEITDLTVEYTSTPLGIDVEKPRFSWQMQVTGNERGYHQTAYQLSVYDENKDKVWDSGIINDDNSLNIEYKGKPLKAMTRYNWHVSVWDQKSKAHNASSWFETGLMNPDPHLSAWNGAKWIGGSNDDLVLYSSYLPVFKLSYTLQMDKKGKIGKAGFIYGANDPRLMDRNKNIYQLQSEKDGSYILIELDIAGIQKEGNAMLNIYRVGYHPNDRKDIPFQSVPVSALLINEKNKYEPHTFHIHSVFGYTHIFINGIEEENRITEINLNPIGRGGDYISFPMIADIGFSVPAGQKATFSNVNILNYRDPSNCLFTGDIYQVDGQKTGKRMTFNPSRNSMPMLRAAFNSPSQAVKARLYITARGVYEVYINGKRIGEDYLNPGLTQYNKTHLYQTYDVTDYVQQGKNAIGALLGEGWWSGGATYSGEFWNFFGDRQSLLAKLVLTYPDGKEEVIVTNPDTWTYYNDGPIIYGSFFQGEVYDSGKEEAVKDWSTANYNDSAWKKASEIGDEYFSRDKLNAERGMPDVGDYSQMQLIGQFGKTVQKIKELTAQSVEEVRPGVFVYDMGQNMVGIPKIALSGHEKGKTITLRYAEVKYPDLPEYEKNKDMIMLENIRAALSQDTYITKGGNEVIRPRFTFHGYRFLEISGMERALPLNAVKGEVISSIHELASSYETSNPKVNKLWENITWSTYANFLSIPTDCPQRNERLGWSGDISVFSRTATYLANVPQFLRRHLFAMRDVQREDGRFADVSPLGGGFGGILWGSAGITAAWESYMQYKDTRMLAEHYEAMKSYIQYLLNKNIDKETGLLVQENPGAWGNLGDWLGLEDGKNDKTLLWEAYFIYDLQLMEKIAGLLDKQEDQALFGKLSDERKTLFSQTYIDPVTCKTIHSGFNIENGKGRLVDIQTSYVLPLAFGLIPGNIKTRFTRNLVETITRENITDNQTVCPPYSLMTGFIGTAWINKALSDNGRSDIAYTLLQQTSYPSWLYSIEQGATTIWERLNSYTHTDGFGGNNSMNSFNHYSFGAIGSWMYNYSLGIERDDNSPGFKHFILKPEPDPTGKMTYAKGHYDSMYGRIESSWEVKEGKYFYRFSIPANTSATLYLPSPGVENIRENEKPVSSSPGIKYIDKQEGKTILELSSGTYNFQVE